MLARSLMGRSREVLVAASAPSTVRDDHTLIRLGEIVNQFATLYVVNTGTNRNFQDDVVACLSGAVGTFAVTPALRVVFRIETKMNQGVVRLARLHDHVPTAPPVAATGAATRDELLPAEGNATVAAVAGLDTDFRFIDEHLKSVPCSGFPVP